MVTSARSGLLIEQFLEENRSQLTFYGLVQLNEAMEDRELAVFFRNNHFSTIWNNKVSTSLRHLKVVSEGSDGRLELSESYQSRFKYFCLFLETVARTGFWSRLCRSSIDRIRNIDRDW